MFTLKFYDGTKGTVFSQVDDFPSVVIEKDVTNYDTATIMLPSSFGGIEIMDKVEVCCPQGGVDTVLFSGYIQGIKGGLHTTVFTAYSEKFFLKKKLCLANVSSSVLLSALLSSLVTNWNAGSGDTLTYSTPSTDFTLTTNSKIGDNFFGILDDTLKNTLQGTTPVPMTFTMVNGNIVVKEFLGIDRSAPGSNFLGAYFRSDNLQDSNVVDPSSEIDSNYANALYTPGGLVKDTVGIAKFGPFAQQYSDTKQSDYTNILANQYGSQKVYNLKIDPSFLKKYGVVTLAGDKIAIDVVAGNYCTYQGNGYIIAETMKLSRVGIEREVTVATNYLKTPDLAQQIIAQNRKLFLRTL